MCLYTGFDSAEFGFFNGAVVGRTITHANVLTKNTLFIPIKRCLSAAISACIFLHRRVVLCNSSEEGLGKERERKKAWISVEILCDVFTYVLMTKLQQ